MSQLFDHEILQEYARDALVRDVCCPKTSGQLDNNLEFDQQDQSSFMEPSFIEKNIEKLIEQEQAAYDQDLDMSQSQMFGRAMSV